STLNKPSMNELRFSALSGTFLLLSGWAGPQYAAIASDSHFASFGTNQVHYLIEGKGSHTIVFVHCWAGNAGLWREQVQELAVHGFLRRPKMAPEQAEQFVAPFRAPEYREHTRQFLGTLFPIPGTETLRDRVVSELLTTPQYVMLGAMEGMFGADQPDWDLKKVTVPVLIINAPNPMWTDAYKAYVRSLSSKTDYRTIDGVGHWLMLEKPAEFNAALTDLLRKFDLIAK